MSWIIKPSKWLLLILSEREDIQRDIETNLTRAAQKTGQDVPSYEIQFLNTSKTRGFPTRFSAVNEIEEEFNENILNDLIIRKKKSKAAKVALIMERNAFPTEDVFEDVVSSIKHDSIYHLICTKGNFLDTEKRKECYTTSCDKCIKKPICEHSCLLRLLWVIFEDKRVLTVLDDKKTIK